MIHKKNKLITLALGISEFAYSEMIYNRGLDWIDAKMSLNNEYIMYEIAKSPKFWDWWTNQWEIRDEEFCYETSLVRQTIPLEADILTIAKELYVEKHIIENIVAIPNKEVRVEISKMLNQEIKRLEAGIKVK